MARRQLAATAARRGPPASLFSRSSSTYMATEKRGGGRLPGTDGIEETRVLGDPCVARRAF